MESVRSTFIKGTLLVGALLIIVSVSGGVKVPWTRVVNRPNIPPTFPEFNLGLLQYSTCDVHGNACVTAKDWPPHATFCAPYGRATLSLSVFAIFSVVAAFVAHARGKERSAAFTFLAVILLVVSWAIWNGTCAQQWIEEMEQQTAQSPDSDVVPSSGFVLSFVATVLLFVSGLVQLGTQTSGARAMLGYSLCLVPGIVVIIWVTRSFPAPYAGYSSDVVNNTWQFFNWHPTLMVIAFATFFSEAIMAFKLLPMSRPRRKLFHFACQTLAVILSSAAIGVIARFKNQVTANHLYSAHAWVGCLAYSLFVVQWIGGVFSFYMPRLPDADRKDFLQWHVWAGVCIYFLTSMGIATGVLSRMWIYGGNDIRDAPYLVGNLVVVSTIALAFFSLAQHVGLRRDNPLDSNKGTVNNFTAPYQTLEDM